MISEHYKGNFKDLYWNTAKMILKIRNDVEDASCDFFYSINNDINNYIMKKYVKVSISLNFGVVSTLH